MSDDIARLERLSHPKGDMNTVGPTQAGAPTLPDAVWGSPAINYSARSSRII